MSLTYLSADNRWPGLARVAPYLLLTIAVNSFTLLVVSCLTTSALPRPLREQFTIYICAIAPPILNILFSILSIYLHRRNRASPSRILALSSTFLVGWLLNFSFRTICDSEEDSGLRYCSYLNSPTKSQQNLQIAGTVLGLLCALAWALLVSLSVAAAYRSKMDCNFRRLNGRDEESSDRLFDQKEILLELENVQ